jgi:hypothetical protein
MGLQLMAVVATLRMRFAEAVTLGTSIGLMMEKGVTPYASPALKKLMPDEYHKWTPFIIATCTKMVGGACEELLTHKLFLLQTQIYPSYQFIAALNDLCICFISHHTRVFGAGWGLDSLDGVPGHLVAVHGGAGRVSRVPGQPALCQIHGVASAGL